MEKYPKYSRKICIATNSTCNLKCIYCYERNKENTEFNDYEALEKIIEIQTYIYEKSKNINFYEPKLDNIPKILETPYINDKGPYKEEIAMIREKKFNDNLKNLFEK